MQNRPSKDELPLHWNASENPQKKFLIRISNSYSTQYYFYGFLVFLAYIIPAHYGLKLSAINGFVTLIWPSSGIALAALLILGSKYWPFIGLAAISVNAYAGAPLPVAIGIGIGNIIETLLGFYLLHSFGFERSLERVKDVFLLIICAGILSTLPSALFGVGSLYLGGLIPPELYFSTLIKWWLGDMMGIILIASFILVWSQKNQTIFHQPKLIFETIFYPFLIFCMSLFIFTNIAHHEFILLLRPYLIFPLLVIVAFRLNQKWLVTCLIIFSTTAIWSTANEPMRFWKGSLSDVLLQLQVFIAVAAITKMFLAASVMERRKRTEEIIRSEKSQRFLINATKIIFESMKDKSTLKNIVQSPVPQFADWCIVHLLSDSYKSRPASIEKIEFYCDEKEKNPLLQDFINTHYSNIYQSPLLNQIFEKKESVAILTANENKLLKFIFKKYNFNSMIACPLLFNNELLGILTLGLMNSDRFFIKKNIPLIEELARRSAIALKNTKLYSEAQDAIRARDDFLSIASHELKTPLTSLSLGLQVLENEIQKNLKNHTPTPTETISIPFKLAKLISTSEKQCKHLINLTEELFDLTRIRLGRIQLKKEKLDFTQLVYEVCEQFKNDALKWGITIKIECEKNLYGFWDRIRVEQIINNLISNGIKYGNKKPILITAQKTNNDQFIQLKVMDHGIGISPDLKEVIFNRFERADTSSDRIPGLGLGLYICRQIAEAHGGTIEVESQLGVGSTFTLNLPIEDFTLDTA